MPGRILILDDDRAICRLLVRELGASGYAAEWSSDPEAGLELLKNRSFGLVITDLRMPGIDGVEFMRRAKRIRPDCEVVIMTAYATVATVRDALKHGAADYLTKPFSIAGDLLPLVRSLFEEPAADATEPLPPPVFEQHARSISDDALRRIVGRSDAMLAIIEDARRVARSNATVLLQGESGTGKEVIASLVQRLSARRDRPFVTINCAALPEGLLESELFGCVKGAFTGATQNRVGLFQVADGGTLLLDEVGETSASIQPKLLRVLQEGEFHRVGDSTRSVRVDVRIIATTNRDLEAAVVSGGFRSDLFYRLNVVPIKVPPLREHREDLLPLVDHFVSLLCTDRRVEFSAEAMALLSRYPWPGNIRELANAVEYAVVMNEGSAVGIDGLPVAIQDFSVLQADSARATGDIPSTLEAIEKRSILQAMVKQDFNRTQAARLLGITRRTLGYRIAKYGLQDELEGKRLTPGPAKRAAMAKVRPLEHVRAASSAGSGAGEER